MLQSALLVIGGRGGSRWYHGVCRIRCYSSGYEVTYGFVVVVVHVTVITLVASSVWYALSQDGGKGSSGNSYYAATNPKLFAYSIV